MRGDHFVLALALLDELRYTIANVDQHISVGDYVGPVHHRAVAWNDLGIGSAGAYGHAQSRDHAVYRAAHIGIPEAEEIANHEHIRFAEVNHAVGIGVGRRH